MSVARRVQRLIDRFFGGSLNRAAQAWRVPQPTLFRLVKGEVRSPRVELLRRIATYHGTTIDWLLDGAGQNPELATPFPIREYREWESLVDQLQLPPDKGRFLLDLPGSTRAAYRILCRWGVPADDHDVPPAESHEAADAVWRAEMYEFQAWITLLQGLIGAYGLAAVRQKLLSEIPRLQLGFQPFAVSLFNWNKLPKELGELYDDYARPTPGIQSVVLIGEPTLPPLDLVARSTSRRPRAGGQARRTRRSEDR